MRKSGKPDLRWTVTDRDGPGSAVHRSALARFALHPVPDTYARALQLPFRRWRQILAGEDVLGLRPVLEVVGQRDLVDRLGQPVHVDAAEAVGLHPRGDEVVAQRHLQP